jgi:hypothetical protein
MPKHRIIYVILITGLLAVPFYLFRDEMDTEEIKKNRYWVIKTRNTETYPVVFGGDSRVFRGISPEDFSSEFGGIESYNFAYWANGYGKDYLEGLERKIDTSAEVQMIILGLTPHSLTEKTAESPHYHWELIRAKRSAVETIYFSTIQEIFAPYRINDLLKRILGKSKPDNYRITYHPNGWVESYWIVPDTSHSARFYKDLFEGDPVSEEVIRNLLEFVERWTRHGIHVVAFRPPTSHTIRHYEHERGGFNEAEFVQRFRDAGGIWIDIDPDDYQTFDGSHLEHQSARRISADLGRQLRERFLE